MQPALDLRRRAVVEAVGTGLLVAVVVGSGIMAERLAHGSAALALLANSFATGAGLIALILTFGPLSGGHFNPVVTLVEAARGERPWREVPAYVSGQLSGALVGVASANVMFGLGPMVASGHVRTGVGQWLGEGIATFGLLATILGTARHRPGAVPYAVGAYIAAGYWFTSSTSFANPAVTLARAATDTFSGIRPVDVPAFIVAQTIGGAAAALLLGWLAQPLVQTPPGAPR
jgi:glycerol uptake facilitator-like aquaporin